MVTVGWGNVTQVSEEKEESGGVRAACREEQMTTSMRELSVFETSAAAAGWGAVTAGAAVKGNPNENGHSVERLPSHITRSGIEL